MERPVKNYSEALEVTFGLTLQQIKHVVTKKQFIIKLKIMLIE